MLLSAAVIRRLFIFNSKHYTQKHKHAHHKQRLITVSHWVITNLPKVIWEVGCIAAKVSPQWLQWRAPNSSSKVPLPVDRSPNHTICLIPGPVWLTMPNGIRIWCAIFPQCTGQTDTPTDWPTNTPTDHPRESLMTINHYASNESDAA